MQETGQPFGNPMSRPSARVASAPMPIQRGSYGIPPRQAAPQPSPVQSVPQPAPQVAPSVAPRPLSAPTTPQFMDIAAPNVALRPQAPQVAPQPQPQVTTPTTPAPATPIPPTAPQQRPLFTPTPNTAPASPEKTHHNRPKLVTITKYGLAGLAILLLVGGAGRWITAGSTANDTIAVGAVSANDGRSMTIQFTATDGLLHKYSTKSDRELIPGSATEIAYRSGAPEATARQVSIVKNARNLGVWLILAGVLCAAIFGITVAIGKLKARNKAHHKSITTPVTA